MKLSFAALTFLFLHVNLFANQDSSRKELGIETAFIVGYTGFNQFLGPVLKLNNNQFYLGSKVNLNSFYLPGHSHLGLSAGYRCFYIESGKFSSYFPLDYQLSYYKLYDPYNYFPKKAKNHIQELVMSL